MTKGVTTISSKDTRIPSLRINDEIKVDKVRLVRLDGTTDIVPIKDALKMADDENLDLVEVGSNESPPVCKIMDYGKYRYEKERKLKEAKKNQKIIDLKEIKFRPKTDEHDYQTKLRHIKRFLKDGDKVKITIWFRGREIVHNDIGMNILKRVIEDLKEECKIEKQPIMEGRNMFCIITPE